MNNFFSNAECIVGMLSRVGGVVSGMFIVAAAVISFYGVFMRQAFNRPPLFVDETVGFLLLGVIFMGWAYALKSGSHINIAILHERLSKRAQNLLDATTLTIGLAFFLLLTKWAFEMWYFNVDMGVVSGTPGRIALWIPSTALILGLPIFTLQFIVEIVHKIKAFREK